MIKLEIKPVQQKRLDCIENVIANAAIYLKKEYQFLHTESWGFGYVNIGESYPPKMFTAARGYTYVPHFIAPSEQINPRICTNKGKAFEYLKKYNGLQITEQEITSFSQLLMLVRQETQNKLPVGMHIGKFNCPWIFEYRRFYGIHYCLIIGVDEKEKIFFCIDSFYNDKINILPFEVVSDYFGKCITFRCYQQYDQEPEGDAIIRHIADYARKEYDGEDMFSSMKKFSDELRTLASLDREIKDFRDLKYVPLFEVLSHLGWARRNAASLIRYLNNSKNTKMNLISDELEKTALCWNIIRGKLVKSCLVDTKRELLDAAADKVDELAGNENKLITHILETC